MIPWLLVACAVCFLVYLAAKAVGTVPSLRTIRLFNQLPGPTDQPFFIGSFWDYRKLKIEDLIPYLKKNFDKFDGWFSFYFIGRPTVMIADPKVIEAVLSSHKNIYKGPEYHFVSRWLREGLILSTGEKWKQRRKMLTPCFHFKVLEKNIECMNRHWRKVAEEFLDSRGAPVEPLSFFERGSFKILCESAMKTVLGDHDDICQEYVDAVKRASLGIIKRNYNPLLRSDFLFDLTALSKSFMGDLKIIHDFSEKVIEKRKVAFAEEKKLEEFESGAYHNEKQRQVIDILLESNSKGGMNDIDMREEVDNFMYAGHDTTSAALQYLMMHLGENPEVQEKASLEQIEIFGHSDRDVTKEDLSEMRYLELVIKESLRLHPSVPHFTRTIVEDIRLPNGLTIPKGVKVVVNAYCTHRNPDYWDDPETFKPERFSLEESADRHPYSYIPFSAGPRNCIGQKFAMMELKICASIILRSCKISATTRSKDLKYQMLITLQPNTPINVKISPRT